MRCDATEVKTYELGCAVLLFMHAATRYLGLEGQSTGAIDATTSRRSAPREVRVRTRIFGTALVDMYSKCGELQLTMEGF